MERGEVTVEDSDRCEKTGAVDRSGLVVLGLMSRLYAYESVKGGDVGRNMAW
jgi:hypothetical protein